MVAFGAFVCIVGPPFFVRSWLAFRLALFVIVVIALWHKAGISPSCGGSPRRSTSVACVRVCVVRGVSMAFGVSVFGLGSRFLAMFRSLEMRFSCLVSDFGMGGCSLVLVWFCGGCVMGNIVWARRW